MSESTEAVLGENFASAIEKSTTAGSVISNLSITPSEQSHAYVAIRTLMNWCVRHGLIEHSVVPPMKQKASERDRVLSENELRQVLERAQ
ncbi:MAG: hypothetical protein ABJN52_04065 [Litorimonas sp.]